MRFIYISLLLCILNIILFSFILVSFFFFYRLILFLNKPMAEISSGKAEANGVEYDQPGLPMNFQGNFLSLFIFFRLISQAYFLFL